MSYMVHASSHTWANGASMEPVAGQTPFSSVADTIDGSVFFGHNNDAQGPSQNGKGFKLIYYYLST